MPWREIWRCDDLAEARAIATAIEAMEFPARLRSSSGLPVEPGGESGTAPFVIDVDEASWPDLIEVVDEIAREQVDFDRSMERWRDHACRRRRAFLLLLIMIVAALALIGAIDL